MWPRPAKNWTCVERRFLEDSKIVTRAERKEKVKNIFFLIDEYTLNPA